MTFSIVGRCADTGQLGIAISSSSIAVGARCPWLRPGVGAVATQNITLPAEGDYGAGCVFLPREPAERRGQGVDELDRAVRAREPLLAAEGMAGIETLRPRRGGGPLGRRVADARVQPIEQASPLREGQRDPSP